MTDPNTQHEICPGCHTHQVVDRQTGRFILHSTIDPNTKCVGSGEQPVHAAINGYAAGSQFQSCPAATGDSARCPHFPDGAHRCTHERGHRAIVAHECTCTMRWLSLMSDSGDFSIQGTYGPQPTVTITTTSARTPA